MQLKKKFTLLIILLLATILLNACGALTEKPTGLEDDEINDPIDLKDSELPDESKRKENNEKSSGNTIIHSITISEETGEIPLIPIEQEIADGTTLLEALIAITKSEEIQMDYRGGQGGSAYVVGIDNVYEFDRGQGSGWTYRINGKFPNLGVGVVSLCGGDRVEWLYTTNLGEDIDSDLEYFRKDGKCPK